MKPLMKLTLIFCISNIAIAQDSKLSEVDFFDALLNSKPDEKKQITKEKLTTAPKNADRESYNYNCSSDEQTSLPLKMFLGLLRNGANGLDMETDEQSGSVSFSGGESMVSNCSAMLDPTLANPGDKTPWTLMVKIKGCGQDKCTYSVSEKVNGRIEISQKKYTPNVQGFVQCMSDAGAYKNGKIQDGQPGRENKVVSGSFSHKFSGVTKTDELLYGSYGPLANQLGLLHSSKNERPGNKCMVYEKLNKEPTKLYSFADAKSRNKKDLFHEICKSGDWLRIDKSIGDFKQFQWMQKILFKVRNELILKDVAKLAIKLEDTKDYRDFTDKEILLIKTYKEKVFDYEVSQVNELYRKYSAARGDDKKNLKKALQKKIKNLQKLTKAPYLSKKHYDLLIASQERKAPLEREAWIEGLKSLTFMIFTADEYEYVGQVDSDGDELLPSEAQSNVSKKMSQFVTNNLKDIEIGHKIRTGQDRSYHSKAIASSHAVAQEDYDKAVENSLKNIQEHQMWVQYKCQKDPDPQGCIQDRIQLIKNCQQNIETATKRFEIAEAQRKKDYDKRKAAEVYRDKSLGIKKKKSTKESKQYEYKDETYADIQKGAPKGQNYTQAAQMMSQQYAQYHQYMQQKNQMRGQQQYSPYNQAYNFNYQGNQGYMQPQQQGMYNNQQYMQPQQGLYNMNQQYMRQPSSQGMFNMNAGFNNQYNMNGMNGMYNTNGYNNINSNQMYNFQYGNGMNGYNNNMYQQPNMLYR